jgi:hypothetical protein
MGTEGEPATYPYHSKGRSPQRLSGYETRKEEKHMWKCINQDLPFFHPCHVSKH